MRNFARSCSLGVTGSLVSLTRAVLVSFTCAALVGCGSSGSDGDGSAGSSGAGGCGAGSALSTAGSNGAGTSSGGGQLGAGSSAGGASGAGSSSGGTPNGGAGGAGGASSAGSSSGGAQGGVSGGASGGAGGKGTAGNGGAPATCATTCVANSKCETATLTCVCNPGFVSQNNVCTAAPVGDPSTHTQADVCTHWKAGHVITEVSPLTTTGGDCSAGTLKPGAITDTLVRMNLFRWFEGLGPVSDDAQYDSDAQACANLEAWWDFSSTFSPHMPPATSKCFTAAGGSTAGQSNISWGSGGPAQSIDQYMEDTGNDTTLGHRRWVVNPPLNPIGIGYWQTGGQYGNASCLRIFAAKGTGPKPSWNAVPPAGFTPIEMAKYKQWSFEGSLAGIANATASVLRVDDNTPLAVTAQALSQGYGEPTMSFKPNGWTAESGKTYRVTISGLGAGNVVYDVKPVTCN